MVTLKVMCLQEEEMGAKKRVRHVGGSVEETSQETRILKYRLMTLSLDKITHLSNNIYALLI